MARNSIDPSERFQLTRTAGELGTQAVGTFGTFSEAEEYRKGLGDEVSHVRFDIIDRTKNIFVDAADASEDEELTRREAIVARRKKLIAEEAALKASESPAPVSQGNAPAHT